jgi:hypothetical protein
MAVSSTSDFEHLQGFSDLRVPWLHAAGVTLSSSYITFLWRAQYFLHTQRVQRTACANACCLLLKEWWVLLLRA